VRPGLLDYVRAAFNARPIGMFVPPNWIGLATFGLLGLANPGFWVLGAGLELGYLSLLATNARFQRTVAGRMSLGSQLSSQQKVQQALGSLTPPDRDRFKLLEGSCQSILELQFAGSIDAPGYRMQAESLGRLTWTYLRLLVTRQTILAVLAAPGMNPSRIIDARGRSLPPPLPADWRSDQESRQLQTRLADLRTRIADETLGDELRRSLTSQAELIQQRIDRRAAATKKLAFIEAELTRIEQQAELIREQAALSTDPESFSQRIDEIGATLTGTVDWIAEQQRTLGAMDDLLSEPIPAASSRAKESQ
jgi:hypothetical protein